MESYLPDGPGYPQVAIPPLSPDINTDHRPNVDVAEAVEEIFNTLDYLYIEYEDGPVMVEWYNKPKEEDFRLDVLRKVNENYILSTVSSAGCTEDMMQTYHFVFDRTNEAEPRILLAQQKFEGDIKGMADVIDAQTKEVKFQGRSEMTTDEVVYILLWTGVITTRSPDVHWERITDILTLEEIKASFPDTADRDEIRKLLEEYSGESPIPNLRLVVDNDLEDTEYSKD